MKKIIIVSSLVMLLAVSVAPAVFAAEKQATECRIGGNLDRINQALEGSGYTCSNPCVFDTSIAGSNPGCALCCLLNTVYTITDWIFFFLVAVAAIMVLVGGFNLLFAGGSPEKIDTGRKYIIFAAVGLLVGLLARAIPALVRVLGGL